MLWKEIIDDPEYQVLPEIQKTRVKAGWFKKYVLADPEYKTLDPERKSRVMQGFLAEEGISTPSERKVEPTPQIEAEMPIVERPPVGVSKLPTKATQPSVWERIKGAIPAALFPPLALAKPEVKEKIIAPYLKYAQPAFKWAVSGAPKEDIEKFFDPKYSWVDVIKDAYPMLKDPESRLSKSVMAQFGAEMGGTLAEIGTRPATYITWAVAERLIPFAVRGVFKKLPKGIQESLIKERFVWGRKPIDLAYKELGLKRGVSLKDVKVAYRNAALKWHPDRAPAGQSIKYTRRFLRTQGAYDRIKASTEIIRQTEAMAKGALPTEVKPTVAKPPTITPKVKPALKMYEEITPKVIAKLTNAEIKVKVSAILSDIRWRESEGYSESQITPLRMKVAELGRGVKPLVTPPITEVAPEVKAEVKLAKLKAKEEFKVGDVIDTQGNSNMVGKATIREIKGNTLYFTDAEGSDFSGLSRSIVRTLISEGKWKKVAKEVKPEVAKPPVAEKEPWQMTKEEFGYDFRKRISDQVTTAAGGKKQIEIAHKIAISQALKEGKPVPKEVLAGYPELAKKPPAEPKIEAVKVTPEVLGEVKLQKEYQASIGGGVQITKTPEGKYIRTSYNSEAIRRWGKTPTSEKEWQRLAVAELERETALIQTDFGKEVLAGRASFAPRVPPERPAVEVTPAGEFIRPSQIAKDLSIYLDVPVRRGKFRGRAAGIYKKFPQVVRLKRGGIQTLSHEIGHHLKTNIPEFNFAKEGMRKYAKIIVKLDYEYPAKGRISEGFSEFVRFYVTEPSEAKVRGKGFYNYFENTLQDKYLSVYDVLQNARADYQSWLKMPAAKKIEAQISFEHPEVKIERRVDIVYRTMIDELNPITKFTSKAKKLGVKIKPEDNPDLLSHLFAGWTAKADQFLKYKTFDSRTLETTGKSFKDIMSPVRGDIKDFTTYLVARRAYKLSNRGITTGIDKKDAVGTILEFNKKYPHFKRVSQELYAFQDRVLDYAVKNGLLSPELKAKIRKLNRDYVPFYRVMEGINAKRGTGRSFANLAKPIKRIKGSEREIINPIESIIKNTYALINASEKNAVNLAIANLSGRDKYLARMFEKVPTPMAKVAQIKVEDIISEEAIAESGLTGEDLDKIVDIFRPSVFTPADNTIVVFRGGKKEFYEVEPALHRALTGLDKEAIGALIKILSYPARWLRAGAVLTPEFSLAKNPLRDQMSAYLYSNYGYKPLYDLMRGVSSLVKKDKYFIDWNRTGGPHAALISLDRNYLKQTESELLKGKKIPYYVKNPLELLRSIAEITEEATRIGEFRRGIEIGADPLEAAMSSKDVTINFSRKGTVGKSLNQIIAFWNANIQGQNKLYRSFKNYPGRTFWRCILGLTLPSIALWFYNKRNNPQYDEIPQWQRDLFWIIPVKVSEKTAPSGIINFRLPKPFLPGLLFGSIPERILDYIETKDPEGIKNIMKTLQESFFPRGGYLPTALGPIIENQTNYSFFFDRPIIPYGEERIEAQLQTVGYTSEVAKKLGRLLNYSPIKIDNMLRGYFAGLGKFGIDGLDKILKSAGLAGTEIDPKKYWFEQPMARAIIIREPIGSASESVNRFYRYYKEAEEAEQTFKKIAETDKEKAKAYLQKRPRALLATYYRGMQKQLSLFREARDKVYKMDELSPLKKRQMIDKINRAMTELASKAIMVEDEFRKLQRH